MEWTALNLTVNGVAEGCVVDLGSLYAALAHVHDKRHARGLRYALVTVLVYIVLAKLAGEDRVSGLPNGLSIDNMLWRRRSPWRDRKRPV